MTKLIRLEDVKPGESYLLLLGESIPDLPYYAVGTRISGSEAEKFGYREYAKYGGWLIWHQQGEDFYIIDADEPLEALSLRSLAQHKGDSNG